MKKIQLRRLLGIFAIASLSVQAQAAPNQNSSLQNLAPKGAQRTQAWNSDISESPADSSIIYGILPNGLTYAIKENDRPQNEVLIRMAVDFGSAAEADDEQGLAHFIEHMAFNGTTNVPEGEMIKILERLGLSFGADTNASTGYTQTQYTLDLPKRNRDTIEQALFLLRETASEITFKPAAVDRERGIIIEEKRSRENFGARSGRSINQLFYPDTYISNRYPIGTEDILNNAPAQRLKQLYKKYYTPDRTKLVIVGPVDTAQIEKMIVEKFGSWTGESRSLGDFDTCSIDTDRQSEVKIFSHPKISEGLAVQQFIADKKRSDGIDSSILRLKIAIANAIISNRINKELRAIDTPILSAGLRFNLNECDQYVSIGYGVSGKDGSRKAMIPFTQKHINSALAYGFQQSEVDEILKAYDNQTSNAIKSEDTRQSARYAAALTRQSDGVVRTSEETRLVFLQAKAFLKADAIHREFKFWYSQLQDPLIFLTTKDINKDIVQSEAALSETALNEDALNEDALNDEAQNNTDLDDGTQSILAKNDEISDPSDSVEAVINEDEADILLDELTQQAVKDELIQAFKQSLTEPAQPIEQKQDVIFAYTDFGPAGKIADDSRIDEFDIRTISFENGVKLNIKSTDFEDNRVRYSVRIDGGEFYFGKDNNILADFMSRTFGTAALGKHDVDDLRSIILGTTASAGFGVSTRYFGRYGSVAPDDLLLQMQLLTAYTQDPGYREEAIRLFKRPLEEFYKGLDSTPGRALSVASAKILTDNDPRFSLPPQEAYENLDFDQLRTALADALKTNALEIGIVGDISEDAAIAAIAQTFGALPKRKTEIPSYDAERIANWSNNRKTHVITHKGEPDQLSWQRIWSTTDDSDYKLSQTMGLLAQIIDLNLTEELREKLGATYGSSVNSSMSSTYTGRGSFNISTSGDVENLALIEETIDKVVADILAQMPSEDIFERARTPRLKSYADWRLRNSTWMGLVDTAQTQPIWIDRFRINEETYKSITREDVWEAAKKFLSNDDYFTFQSIPEGSASQGKFAI